MQNPKGLQVLVVDENKSNTEFLTVLIKTNIKSGQILVQSILEPGQLNEAVKMNEFKPHLIFLIEPAIGKIKFSFEVSSYITNIKKISPLSEIIVITSPNKTTTVLEAFHAGAFDVVLNDAYASNNIINSIQRYLEAHPFPSGFSKEIRFTEIF